MKDKCKGTLGKKTLTLLLNKKHNCDDVDG
jgi:hypothetical protein